MTDTSVQVLPLASVYALGQDRKNFDEAGLQELADSIRQHGLAQPITVRPDSEGRFVIVAGERRFRAHELLGKPTIDAIVKSDMTDAQHSAVQLIENVQRVDLDPIEEAMAYKVRMEQFGFSVDKLAKWAGKPAGVVRNRLQLLNLAPEFVQMMRSGALATSHGQEMAKLDANRQRLAIKALGEGNGLSFWQFQKLCEQLFAEQQQDSMFDPDSFLKVAEYQADARKASVIRVRDLIESIEKVLPTLKLIAGSVDLTIPEVAGEDGARLLAEFLEMADHAVATRGSDKATKGSSSDKLNKTRPKKGR